MSKVIRNFRLRRVLTLHLAIADGEHDTFVLLCDRYWHNNRDAIASEI